MCKIDVVKGTMWGMACEKPWGVVAQPFLSYGAKDIAEASGVGGDGWS